MNWSKRSGGMIGGSAFRRGRTYILRMRGVSICKIMEKKRGELTTSIISKSLTYAISPLMSSNMMLEIKYQSHYADFEGG
jgi:hypothetical protein